MKLITYLSFPGTTEDAFRYYEQHLGAKILFMMRWNQMPGPNAARDTPRGFVDKVMHATLAIADSTLMASDSPGVEPMRAAHISLSVDSTDEAERIYNSLADGGEVSMALTETFFAHRFGQVRDRFGVNWMIIHNKPMQQA